MEELLRIDDRHPSDIAFLPDVNHADAGYLFVAKEYDKRRVSVYRWSPGDDFAPQGQIFQGFPAVLPGDPEPPGGPNFLFIDRVGYTYYLGVASSHSGWGRLLSAQAERLFPKCRQGGLGVSVHPGRHVPWPVTGDGGGVELRRRVSLLADESLRAASGRGFRTQSAPRARRAAARSGRGCRDR
jgi:hypothetical protein